MKKKIIITESQLVNLLKKRGRPRNPRTEGNINLSSPPQIRDRYVPEWSYKQNLVAFYCYKFGPNNLRIGPKYDIDAQLQEISNHYIGTIPGSLRMQMSNFQYLSTKDTIEPKGLKDYSRVQENVFNEHKDDTETEMRNYVLEYFDTLDTEKIYNIFIEKFERFNNIKTKKELQKQLERSNKMAKDYEDAQIRMKGLNPKTTKSSGNSKIHLINFLKNNLENIFNVEFKPNLIRVFEKGPVFKKTFMGKPLPNAPNPKSPDYGQLSGEEILNMIENDPIDAVLDRVLYESKNKKIRLTESEFKNVIKKSLEELDYQEFKNRDNLQILRDSLNKNKMVSVVFVKKDGTVRTMLMRKKLSSYQFSDKEKSEKQINIKENNNIVPVIDVNLYKKSLRENGGDRGLSAKMAYRSINLETVLGFMASGQFFDLRDENNIRERFGEQVYNSLTKTMINKLEEIEQDTHDGVGI